MVYRLRLLGGFELRLGGSAVTLPPSTQRLVAYVGLRDRPASRISVAATLWLDSSDHQALANLRSALWRLRQGGPNLIDLDGEQLSLARDVEVDVRVVRDHARAMMESDVTRRGARITDVESASLLLPDWYDDWVLLERERFRQLRMHALESLCIQLTASRQYARAADVGLLVVADEPLRESAHRALMKVHLAEGNAAEAIRQYRLYERIMRDELGLGPSSQMLELLAVVRATSQDPKADRDAVVTQDPDTLPEWGALPSRSPTQSYAPGALQSAKRR